MKYLKTYEERVRKYKDPIPPKFYLDDDSDAVRLRPEHRVIYDNLKYKIGDYINLVYDDSTVYQITAIDFYDEANYLIGDIDDFDEHHWILADEISRKLEEYEISARKYNI